MFYEGFGDASEITVKRFNDAFLALLSGYNVKKVDKLCVCNDIGIHVQDAGRR